MKRSSTGLALLTMTLLMMSVGCKKKPTYLSVSIGGGIKPYEITMSASGEPIAYSGTYPSAGRSFPPNATPKDISIDVTYPTPCGKKTFTLKPVGAMFEDKFDKRYSFDLTQDHLPGRTLLVFDPRLEGAISIGEITLPSPLPKEYYVTFGSCPRTVKVDGRDVAIPETRLGDRVLVARSPNACYRDGEVRFGPADAGCRPDSSKRLTGQSTYVLDHWWEYLFEGVPVSTKIGSGRCTNSRYLQTCN